MANKKQQNGEVSLSHDVTSEQWYVGFSTGTTRHEHAVAKWSGGTREEAELTEFCDAMGLPLSNVHNRIPRRERPYEQRKYEEIDIL